MQISNSQPKTGESAILSCFNRYKHLATYYAHKVFNAHRIGFEFEDLVQEFEMKIYTSIIVYATKWKKYKADGRYKPVPLQYYIKSALLKRKIDFMNGIRNEKCITLSVEYDNFDYSVCSSLEKVEEVNDKVCKVEINGVDLFEGMTTQQARCFLLYLKGFQIHKLKKAFMKHNFEVEQVIAKQIEFLKTKKSELLENRIMEFKSHKVDAEIN